MLQCFPGLSFLGYSTISQKKELSKSKICWKWAIKQNTDQKAD